MLFLASLVSLESLCALLSPLQLVPFRSLPISLLGHLFFLWGLLGLGSCRVSLLDPFLILSLSVLFVLPP